ncbi:MAG TPA: retropepsin-like aspartic protease [Flavobacteriales bacterium]|jgi:hypothetical protein|nr:retropepsin-like aspartic protease [Flavobacteriales bacterium]
MIRFFFLVSCCIVLLVPARAQEPSDSIVNSAGTYLGSRAKWMNDCRKAFEEDEELAALNAGPACACMMTTLLASSTVDRSTDKDLMDKLDFDEVAKSDPALARQFEQCLMDNVRGDVALKTLGPENLKQIEHECALEIRAQAGDQLEAAGVDVDILCACMMRQLIAHDLGINDLEKAQDPNSPLFNEVMVPCVTEAQASVKRRPDAEVIGPAGPVNVPVIAFDKVHKVKVTVGGTENYFVIDSGANDCFISSTLADQLRANGALPEKDRLPDMRYAMADGTQVLCQRYVIHGVTVGPYTVNGVVFAVIDQKGIQYLLGKSWLGQFSSWHVDAAQKTLVLTK